VADTAGAKMMRVFILSTYEEHGAFGVVATLDQNKIVPLIRERFTDFEPAAIEEAASNATYLLAQPLPDKTAGADLNKKWGGIQLHIVELS
jgi:hypothetical protein